MRRFVAAIAGVAVAVIGCENSGSDRVLGIEATGDVAGFVYFDNNANREADAGDGTVGGVEISLLAVRTRVAMVSSDDLGVFLFTGVPVGVALLMDWIEPSFKCVCTAIKSIKIGR